MLLLHQQMKNEKSKSKSSSQGTSAIQLQGRCHASPGCRNQNLEVEHPVKFKIRIVHKGLILVAVPLIFGIAFISSLCCGLADANRLVERELRLKDAIISHITVLECSTAVTSGKLLYIITQNPMYKDYYASNRKHALIADKHLRKLLRDEPYLSVPPLPRQITQARAPVGLLAQPTSLTTSPLLWQLSRMCDDQSKAALAAVNALQMLLCGGVLVGAVISIVLAVFFCLNITSRLLVIVNNTLSLSQGQALNPPVKGNDEIAELDQFLFDSAREIRELERFKKEMVGVVSHELKSPLTSIGGFLFSLENGVFGELSTKAKDKVQRTYSSVKRLTGLVGELLYLDRLELEMNREEVAADELVVSAVDTVRELSKQLGVEIQVKSSGGRIFADRNRLVQVIVNLLSNAMKFSPPDGVVTLETQLTQGCFECRVSDQGRGIPEAFRKQIFEPFKQVDAKDSTAKKGTGLGLTISRSIVEQHGGTIGIESEEGKGSTFWFKIPDSPQQHTQALQSDKKNEVEAVAGKTRRTRKFSVLQQGLVIIAVPLAFQIAFAGVVGFLLNQVCEQTRQERNSREVLDSLIRTTDALINSIVMTVSVTDFSQQTLLLSEPGKKRAIHWLVRARQLSAADPRQVEDLEEGKRAMSEIFAVFAPGAAHDETGDDGQAGEGTLSRMQLAGRSIDKKLSKPMFRLQELQDRAMDREKKKGELISRQRSDMIRILELTLAGGFVVSIVLSTLLAVSLMRSLTNRLHHVMENTARLVKREPLDPPKGGNDEICYLDRMLFETGNHLVELETFKRQLISIVSHELRTPLMSVSSSLELFDTGVLGEISQKGKTRLKYAQEETDRLIRLINDLLDIEKMEAGKFVLDKSDVNVAELVNASIAAVAQIADSRQIRIEPVVADSAGPLWADRDRLCQVLVNLLSNAIKFSPENETIEVSVQNLSAETADCGTAQLKFCVTDHGRGIPEELRTKIFDRFVQVEKSDETVRGGSGLGLAISKAIVEQHGGTIGVDSEMFRGSTFWFVLPLVREISKKQ